MATTTKSSAMRKSGGKPSFLTPKEEIEALKQKLFSAQKENKRLKKANARLEGGGTPDAVKVNVVEMFASTAKKGMQPVVRSLDFRGPNASAPAASMEKQQVAKMVDYSPSTSAAAAQKRAMDVAKPAATKLAAKPAAMKTVANPAAVQKAAKPVALKTATKRAAAKDEANLATSKRVAKPATDAQEDGSEEAMDQGLAADGSAREDVVEPQEAQSSGAAKKRKSGDGRIPAITAYEVDVKGLKQWLEAGGIKDFFVKILNKNVTNIYCTSLEDYQMTKNLLELHTIKFYSYTPRALRPYNVVVKGLSGDYEEEDVRGHFSYLKLQVELNKVTHIGADRWLLQLGRKSDLEGLYRVKYFLHCRVYMTKYKKSGITQCFNCQRFGHVAVNCKMTFRCVKCASTHTPGKCAILSLEEEAENPDVVRPERPPIKCVNCNAVGHSAGSLQCPKRLAILKRRSEAKQKKPEARAASLCRKVTRDVSFAEMAGGNSKRATPKPERYTNSLDGEFKRLFKNDLLTCLQKMGDFPQKYAQLTNDADRSQALLLLLVQLAS